MIKKFSEYHNGESLNEGASNFEKFNSKLKDVWESILTKAESEALAKFKTIISKELIGNTTTDVYYPITKIVDIAYAWDYEQSRLLKVTVGFDGGWKDKVITYRIS